MTEVEQLRAKVAALVGALREAMRLSGSLRVCDGHRINTRPFVAGADELRDHIRAALAAADSPQPAPVTREQVEREVADWLDLHPHWRLAAHRVRTSACRLPEAAAAPQPPRECTGLTAAWCPVHGDCTCPRDADNESGLDSSKCPLHADSSAHGEGRDAPPRAEPTVYRCMLHSAEGCPECTWDAARAGRCCMGLAKVCKSCPLDAPPRASAEPPDEESRRYIAPGYRVKRVSDGPLPYLVESIDGEYGERLAHMDEVVRATWRRNDALTERGLPLPRAPLMCKWHPSTPVAECFHQPNESAPEPCEHRRDYTGIDWSQRGACPQCPSEPPVASGDVPEYKDEEECSHPENRCVIKGRLWRCEDCGYRYPDRIAGRVADVVAAELIRFDNRILAARPAPELPPLPEGWTIDGADIRTAWRNSPEQLERGYRGYRMAEWDGETLRIISAKELPATVLRALLREPAPVPAGDRVAETLRAGLREAARQPTYARAADHMVQAMHEALVLLGATEGNNG